MNSSASASPAGKRYLATSVPVTIIACVFVLALVIFLGVGRWLIVEDPLDKAQAIVVLSGGMPIRALEAARLYNAGLGPQIWLTRGVEPGLPNPSKPTIVVHREGDHAVIDYRFKKPTGSQPPPVGIVVSVDTADDESPPATYTFQVTALEETVEHPLELEQGPYLVRVTAFSQGGGASDAATARLVT